MDEGRGARDRCDFSFEGSPRRQSNSRQEELFQRFVFQLKIAEAMQLVEGRL